MRLDRSPPTDPSASGGSLGWQSVSSVVVNGPGRSTSARRRGLPATARRPTAASRWGAPTNGSIAVITAPGETLVQFQRHRRSRQRLGLGTGRQHAPEHRPHRPHAADPARGGRRVAELAQRRLRSDLGQRRHRRPVRRRPLRVPHLGRRRHHLGIDRRPARRRSSPPRARPSRSSAPSTRPATCPAGRRPSPTPRATVRLDRTPPPAPDSTGGSLSWQNVAQVTLTAAGSTDPLSAASPATSTARPSTVAPPGRWRLPARWSRPPRRARRWCSSAPPTPPATSPTGARPRCTAGGTARIDRTAPTVPTVSGGSLSWQSATSVSVTAAAPPTRPVAESPPTSTARPPTAAPPGGRR